MTKRKQKRWTSEQQILEAIESAKDMQKRAVFEADQLLKSAGVLRELNQPGLREEIAHRLHRADKAVARVELYEAKAHKLGVKLSQFRTALLPDMEHKDEGVV